MLRGCPCLSMYGDTTMSPSISTCSATVPIKKYKDRKDHNKYAPAKWEVATIEIDNESMSIALPFDEYPADVEVEMLTAPSGFWSATLTDAQSTIEGFVAIPGEYSITISTSDYNTYVGNFSIE